MAINFNLLDHFNLIGCLSRCFKHTDKTSPGVMKTSICAKTQTRVPSEERRGRWGVAHHFAGTSQAASRIETRLQALNSICCLWPKAAATRKNREDVGDDTKWEEIGVRCSDVSQNNLACFQFFISQRLCALSRTLCSKGTWSLGGLQCKILLYQGKMEEQVPENFRDGNEMIHWMGKRQYKGEANPCALWAWGEKKMLERKGNGGNSEAVYNGL